MSSGRIYVSLSSDSTCVTQLKSATSGFESMILSPIVSATTLAAAATASTSSLAAVDEESGIGSRCRFPDWTQAKWESGRIDGSVFVFRDEGSSFQTLTSKCVTRQTPYPGSSSDRYVIHTTTQW